MSECKVSCDKCEIEEFCGYSVDTLGYDRFLEIVKQHDKQIRAEVLKEVEDTMYHEAFKVSHEEDGLQKWDGGNWIRYKLFENVMGKLRQTNGSSIEEENK